MARCFYVNGLYKYEMDARVLVEDRGYQFGDGVYEVWAVVEGHLIYEDWHFARLQRSLKELRIPFPMDLRALKTVLSETIRRNRVRHGFLYLQISRGVARRHHAFPEDHVMPGIVAVARPFLHHPFKPDAVFPISVISGPDLRWKRCDIKSINLLANVLGKQEAYENGAQEIWFLDEKHHVTEGSSSNAWIVSEKGYIQTRPLSNDILPGITRQAVLELAAEENIRIKEEPFTLEQAFCAEEAFITSSTRGIIPVAYINTRKIGKESPGPVVNTLRQAFFKKTALETIRV